MYVLKQCDIFSLGITMYEIVRQQPLQSNGREWHDLRHGKLERMEGAPFALQQIIKEMMCPDVHQRPTAANLLTRRQLLSDEQLALLYERNKARQADIALQQERQQRNTPPQRFLKRFHSII